MQIFVGGLDPSITEADLQLAFESFGPVHRVRICTHKATGRSRGFGFISMRPWEGAVRQSPRWRKYHRLTPSFCGGIQFMTTKPITFTCSLRDIDYLTTELSRPPDAC